MGPAGQELRELARSTGARIEFPGFVPDADLPALLLQVRAAWVTASRYEGFGLPALEALVVRHAGSWPSTRGRCPRSPARAH